MPVIGPGVGFGPRFGVKLRGVWLFASLAWAQITDDKRFKLLMKLAGTDEADLSDRDHRD